MTGPRTFRESTSAALHRLDRRDIVVATVVAGTIDAAVSALLFVVVRHSFTLETLLQWIASGVLGRSAFATGFAGLATAALGVVVHYAFTAVFVTAWAALAGGLRSTRAVVVGGLAYGSLIWVVNSLVLLPLLGVSHDTPVSGYWWAQLANHAAFITVATLIIARRILARRAA